MTTAIDQTPQLSSSALRQAIATKQRLAHGLMQQRPAFFGVGVGQSLDDPRQAALVIFVDRRQIPSDLPPTIGGLRTRYVVMDRLHVTRSYAVPFEVKRHCSTRSGPGLSVESDPESLFNPGSLDLP